MIRRHVAILLSHYLPGYRVGGPVTSVKNIVDNLNHAFQFQVITTNADLGQLTPYPGIVANQWVESNNCRILYVDRTKPKIPQIRKAINGIDVDVLHLNSLFDLQFTIGTLMLKRVGMIRVQNVVLSPRGEVFPEALEFKRTKKKWFLRTAKILNLFKDVRIHATNELEQECAAKVLHVPSTQVHLARVISRYQTDLPNGQLNNLTYEVGKARMVFLARISKDKNIEYVFDVFDLLPPEVRIEFDVWGPIEDKEIWMRCLKRIEMLPSNITVQYRGVAEKERAREILSSYDLFFMPTFAENFGHSIAEALSVGTPVLISDNTPWKQLKSRSLGWDLPLSDRTAFAKAIVEVCNQGDFERRKVRSTVSNLAKTILNDPSVIEENIRLYDFAYR